MKALILLVISLLTFISCSEKKVSHVEALDYYITIGAASVRERDSFQKFKSVLSHSVEIAKARNPQKLNSQELDCLETTFRNLVSICESDLAIVDKLPEVNSTINLKGKFRESIEVNKGALQQLIPHVITALKNGLETTTENYEKQWEIFRESSKKSTQLKTEIGQLSEQFMLLYNIQYEEIEPYGL